jgi:PDZ domain-containing protein
VGAAVLPVPYIALAPGPLYDTIGKAGGKPVISVQDHAAYPPTSGHLYLTTVSVIGAPTYPHLTLFEAMRYWLDDSVAVVPREVEYPPGTDNQKAKQETAQQMVQSQDAAKIAALRFLGEKATTSGLVIDSVTSGAPADGVLKAGDQLKSVDGTAISSTQELRQQIRKHPPGDTVTIGYVRDGTPAEAKIKTVAAPDDSKASVIGIAPSEQCPCNTPFEVKIGLGENVGGPSAGLMFTLGIIDTLTPGDLTRGMTIAGTGTMDVNGNVGPIGGIKQKLIAAQRKGAVAFLVPSDNWDAANVSPPKGMQLRKVTDLASAVREVCAVTGATGKPCAG